MMSDICLNGSSEMVLRSRFGVDPKIISPLQGFDFIHGRSIYNNAIPSGFLKKNARWNER
jgi:hypothetical protein